MMKNIIDKIERYKFECGAGKLENCKDWIALKEQVEKLEIYMNAFKEITRNSNKVAMKFTETPKDIFSKIIYVWRNIFKDFPDK